MQDLQLILWDLAQSQHLAESQRFAKLVQGELNQALQLRDRGVKQAPFRVLRGAAMPAVLVELGFLSNPDEEKKLQDPEYRGQLIAALARAIQRYKALVENRPDPTLPVPAPGPGAPLTPVPSPTPGGEGGPGAP
jgi:N-acetylmuramoyl-L-alanine amidase